MWRASNSQSVGVAATGLPLSLRTQKRQNLPLNAHITTTKGNSKCMGKKSRQRRKERRAAERAALRKVEQHKETSIEVASKPIENVDLKISSKSNLVPKQDDESTASKQKSEPEHTSQSQTEN